MPQRDFIYRKVHVGSAWHLPHGGGVGGAASLVAVLDLYWLQCEVRGDVTALSVSRGYYH